MHLIAKKEIKECYFLTLTPEQRLLCRHAVVERMTMTGPPQRKDDAHATIDRRAWERGKSTEHTMEGRPP